ncbi:recombinase RecT, partial [Escherichia coli]
KNGNPYIAPGWTLKDEEGCGVRVWATMKGEDQPRVLELMLSQAQVRNSTLWASNPKQQLAYLATKHWSRLHCPDVIMGVYTPDELQETAPRVERDITPQTTTAAGMNSLINAKPVKKPDEQTRKADSRDPEEMLMAFTSAAMNYSTVSELDKAYKYIAQKLSDDDELLAKATDVYSVRREELNETSM